MNNRVTNLIAAALITLVVLSGYTPSTSVVSDDFLRDLPVHIHLTWQRNNTTHTITVTWQTTTSTAGDTVLYDTEPHSGKVSLYQYSVNGSHRTYSGASGYIHDVELTLLMPNQTYYFLCGDSEGGYSSERSFQTGPPFCPYFDPTFIVGGDCRTQDWIRDIMSRTMNDFNPSFVLFVGDLVENGGSQSQWDSFFNHMHLYWISEKNLTIPIMPCLGNHESPFTEYFEQFALPGNEQWYSFDYGPNIHIVCLNSETDLAGILEQKEWLENDLSTYSNRYIWKIVFFHRHPFNASHGAWTPALDYWVPLFDKYHVDLVFNGHSHAYYRSKPINWTKSQTEQQQAFKDGTVYVVSGGWGAPLHAVSDWWGWACAESIYNFVVVDVYFNSLHLQAKDNMGNTFDEIWFRHLDC